MNDKSSDFAEKTSVMNSGVKTNHEKHANISIPCFSSHKLVSKRNFENLKGISPENKVSNSVQLLQGASGSFSKNITAESRDNNVEAKTDGLLDNIQPKSNLKHSPKRKNQVSDELNPSNFLVTCPNQSETINSVEMHKKNLYPETELNVQTDLYKKESYAVNDQEESSENESGDDIICVDSPPKKFSDYDLRKSIKNIIRNMLEEGILLDEIMPKLISRRLCSLHNRNFNTESVSKMVESVKNSFSCNLVKSTLESSKIVVAGVRKCDMDTLQQCEWLNDVIVNYYLKLVTSNCNNRWVAISSFFIEEIERMRKMKKEGSCLPSDWQSKENMIIPMCIDCHWLMLHVNILRKTIRVFNSLDTTRLERKRIGVVQQYLSQQSKSVVEDGIEWKLTFEKCPVQENGSDCGVYVCMFARMIVHDLKSEFNSKHAAEFRDWMKQEILQQKLMR